MSDAAPLIIESLPAIDIAAGAERLLFIERMGILASNVPGLGVEIHRDGFGNEGLHVVNLVLPGSTDSLKSGGQLIVRPAEPRVNVEMYSADWSAGGHPTTRAYVEFARAFFQPILRRYNRQFGTRHRLRVVKAKGYVTPPQTKLLLDRFATLANVRSLHPNDWQRFYVFVRHSRSQIPEGMLRQLLMKKGFAADKARALDELYQHLWRFKTLDAR